MKKPSADALDENPERRETPRRRKLLKVLVSDAAAEAEPTTGWVSDRSIGGLSLFYGRRQVLGTVLSVRPATRQAAWVQVQVLSCRRSETDWLLGCRFVRQPSYFMLLQFG